MADSTTTGSTSIGLMDGLSNSVIASGTFMTPLPTMTYSSINPNFSITSRTGSDIIFCIGDGEFYIGDITNGIGGSEWTVMTA